MSETLFQQLESLKRKFANPATPEDLFIIEGWERTAKRAAIVRHLAEHEAMVAILNQLRRDVADMDFLLLNASSSDLPDLERDRVLDRKALYNAFLAYFDGAGNELRTVAAEVNLNLKNGQS